MLAAASLPMQGLCAGQWLKAHVHYFGLGALPGTRAEPALTLHRTGHLSTVRSGVCVALDGLAGCTDRTGRAGADANLTSFSKNEQNS